MPMPPVDLTGPLLPPPQLLDNSAETSANTIAGNIECLQAPKSLTTGTEQGTHGSFETDSPLTIMKADMKTGRLFLTVAWNKRSDGSQP